jgi:hypothetical protein
MDCNVFLLSRIHEAYNEGDGPRESVIHGMGRIGKVVVFAGLIMSAVFQRDVGKHAVQPGGQPPCAVAQQRDHRGSDDHAHDQDVDQDREAQAQAEPPRSSPSVRR